MCNHHDIKSKLDIDPNLLKPLFKTKPLVHLLAIIIDWFIISTTIMISELYWSPLIFFIAIIIIGARMHALAILMHDAAHFRFLKNRKWNDIITNYVTMYPVFTSIEKYRDNHLKHHANLNTENDPDWVAKIGKRVFTFPQSRWAFIGTILSYLTLYQGISDVLWFLRRFGGAREGSEKKFIDKLPAMLFYLGLFSALYIFNGWMIFLLYWVLPYLTTFFMFQYIRSVAEHFGEMKYEHDLNSTRTVKPTWMERFFISPHHVGYHLEHHLYPGVPFYNLPALHRLLMNQKFYSEEAHITQGYTFGLLRELT